MSATDFKRQLEACGSRREVERLLQSWHAVNGTLAEFEQLRAAVIAKVDGFGD